MQNITWHHHHAGIIGAHYPITKPGVQMPPPPPSCYEMDKPLWTSEGWDLGQVNDWKGAINLGAQRPRHVAQSYLPRPSPAQPSLA